MKARKRVTSQKLHELEALIKEREADAAILPPGRKRPKRPMDAGPRLGERPMIDLPEKLQAALAKAAEYESLGSLAAEPRQPRIRKGKPRPTLPSRLAASFLLRAVR
jgi:hypothetical protein